MFSAFRNNIRCFSSECITVLYSYALSIDFIHALTNVKARYTERTAQFIKLSHDISCPTIGSNDTMLSSMASDIERTVIE